MNSRARFALAFLLIAVALVGGVVTLTGAQTPVRQGLEKITSTDQYQALPQGVSLDVLKARMAQSDRINAAATFNLNSKGPQPIGDFVSDKRPDSYPERLGPALVDAVLNTGAAGTADDVLWLIFNRDIDPTAFSSDDIEFINGVTTTTFPSLSFAWHPKDAAPAPAAGEYENVLQVSGFTTPITTTWQVQVRNPQKNLVSTLPGNGKIFNDATRVPIKGGPAITKVQVIAGGARDYLNDASTGQLRVFFTHELVTAGGLANAANARTFFLAPELGTTGTFPEIANYTQFNSWLEIDFTDDDTQGEIREGATALKINGAGRFTGRRAAGFSNETNQTPRWVTSENGPIWYVRGGYNPYDQIATLVYSDDVDPSYFQASPGSYFDLYTGGFFGTPVPYTNVIATGNNVVTLTGVDDSGGNPDYASSTIVDYQGNGGGQDGPVVPSPIIVLSNFRDGGTPADYTDDRINVWFDVDVTPAAPPGPGNFVFKGITAPDGFSVTVPSVGRQASIAYVVGNPVATPPTNSWNLGDRIGLDPAVAINFVDDGGTPRSNGTPAPDMAWIRDGSNPTQLLYANPFRSDVDDTAFVGWDEAGVDDAAYYLFYSRRLISVTEDYVRDYADDALAVTDPSAGDLNTRITTTLTIDVTSSDTRGEALQQGDNVFFAVVPVDLEGNWRPSQLVPLGSLVAGPLAPPRDVLITDSDVIHVFGVDPSSEGPYSVGVHYVCADSGSAPVDADSVRVYADDTRTVLLGSAPVIKTGPIAGAFGPIELANPFGSSVPYLYLVSVQALGGVAIESAQQTEIINDIAFPTLASAVDPVNSMLCYSGGDTLRILALINDPVELGDAGSFPNARSALMHVWADLSQYVKTAGADSVMLISLGANQVDDDNDWIDTDGDGAYDWPEPYVDENGDGSYTPGETFIDIAATGNVPKVYDAGDANLDSNDPDEFGWYYLPGYELKTADLIADPNGSVNFAKLEDLPLYLNIEDNAVRSDWADNVVYGDKFTAQMSAISHGKTNFIEPLGTVCPSYSMEHRIAPELLADEDAQAPTVSEISFLERQPALTEASGAPADNIIIPGDHAYTVAAGTVSPYFNIADSTLSDDDVILAALQINNGSGWQYMSFDPTGDANGDGAPGILGYDDDEDYAGGDVNEDGVVNELDGIDLGDMEVVDAMQDSLADFNAPAGDGIYRTTDLRDNDNDAFFRYNPITGGYIWFNIDENQTNGIDDNGNGTIDDAAEVETYTPASDDDEDGIVDASAVGITVSYDQWIQTVPAGAGSFTIYVGGFVDPANIAKYKGTPASAKPDWFNSSIALATWPNDLISPEKTFFQAPNLDFYPNRYEFLSGVLKGRDDLAGTSFAKGAPNIISAAGQTNPSAGGVPWPTLSNGTTAFAFDYRAQNGRNLNLHVIKGLYNLQDGVEFQIRAVAFDACYQGNPNWAVPLRLVPDSDVPPGDIVEASGEFCDVQMTDNSDPADGADPMVHTFTTDISEADAADVAAANLQVWNRNTEAWDVYATDTSYPFQFDWSYKSVTDFLIGGDNPAALSNDPPDNRDTLYFRVVTEDLYGNTEEDALCDSLYDAPGGNPCFEVEAVIVDCTAPYSCLCQIGTDYDPSDGAFVPSESAVDLSACIDDLDGDPATFDVRRVNFEYRLVGSGNTWAPIASLTGVPDAPDSLVDVTGIRHPIIQPDPNVDTWVVTVTWDTRGLAAGSYDLRAVATDIEGNSNPNMTCVATATVDNIGLRAYIQPCVPFAANSDSLFANVYIHDYSVRQVTFQFYEDSDGDGVDNDGNDWVTIDIQGDNGAERKGDVVLRAGTAQQRVAKNASPELLLGGTFDHRFYDVDGDGYNPVDPIVYDANSNGVYDAGDVVLIDANYVLPVGATLTQFAADEYFADINNDNVLDETDWILKDNPLDGSDATLDMWCAVWDHTGLQGAYLLRAVAMDQLGNTDDDGDGNGIPDSSPTVIWTEECTLEGDVPLFCVTSVEEEDGTVTPLAFEPTCPWIGPQDVLVFTATTTGDASGIDSVRFEYSTDGGYTWEWFATDFYGPDWTGEFNFADLELVLPTDTQTNFRARGYKGGFTATDPNSCKGCLVLGENKGPEADFVFVVTAEGDTLDLNTVLRGNGDPLCLDDTSLWMLATAEDNQTIEKVEVWYRKAAGLTPDDVTEWAVVPGAVDTSYPYEFNWDISGLADGLYEFFPRATDVNGNQTPIFGNPFRFAKSSQTAFVTAVEKNGLGVSSLTPGEEVVVKGDLDDPSDNIGVMVSFYYAERVTGEMLDVDSDVPYLADTEFNIWSGGAAGMHGSEQVYVGGVLATWHSVADFLANYATLGATDYTILDNNTLRFGAYPGNGVEVTIDYNVTDCTQIATGDDDAPYSVAWDADTGIVVPVKSYPEVTHYDIIASASRVFRDEDGGTFYTCEESCVSEGFILPIADTEAPEFTIHGLLCLDLGHGNDLVVNAPGNPLCPTCGGTDISGPFGSCKCKLSGIEHQIFVTGDADIASVQMAVNGDASVDFVKYKAAEEGEDPVYIDIPLTFYIDDLADVTANGWNSQAVNPDSVENVTITIPAAGVFNVELTNLGDGVYQYIAHLEVGGTYPYTYSVDMVGDDQLTNIADPRWSTSTILVPGEFWFYDIEDPAAFWGVNELDQVHFTVTDNDGNVSTNLMSGGFEGAAGQMWITYDPTPEPIRSIWLSDMVVHPGQEEIQINIEAGDIVPPTADIIKLEGVIIQVAVDDTRTRWRTIFEDYVDQENTNPNGFWNWTYDGGWGGYFDLPAWMNPYTDHIDNDRDGLTDEPDEKMYTYGLRVVTIDDCYNYGYSCSHPRAQTPEVCSEITVDAQLPQACITSPTDGDIITMGDVVTITASTSDDDVHHVLFQYSTDTGDTWNDIDWTPLNDDDDPWVPASASVGGVYSVSWDTNFLARELAGDFYVSLRAVATDNAGNEQVDDPELDCNVNVILNDTTGPVSFITVFFADCFPEDPLWLTNAKRVFDPTLALSGEVEVGGRAYGWNAIDVATVVVEISSDGENWQTLGVDKEFPTGGPFNTDFGALFRIYWDTDLWAEGTYWLRSYATDADGNVQNDADGDGKADELIPVKVLVDHTPPEAVLVRVGPEGLPAGNGYTLGGVATTLDEGDLVRADQLGQEVTICPELSPRITFQAQATDVNGDTEFIDSMVLQFLDDVTTPENPTWRTISDNFEYRDALGNDNNPDGKWVYVYEGGLEELAYAMMDAAGTDLPSKEYRFRMRGTDYACNANEDNEGILLLVDPWTPEINYIYAGDREFEAGAGAQGQAVVHVAGGDTVPLAAKINDTGPYAYPDDGGPGPHIIPDLSSGIFAVQFAWVDGEGNRTVIGLGTYDDGGTPGDEPLQVEDDLWKIDWATPMNMAGTTDTLYTIEVTVRDNAGNCDHNEAEDIIRVQDVTPPENTKLVAVIGEGCSELNGNTYPWTPIDEGNDGPYGEAMGIDEAVLNQDLTGAKVLGIVARDVELVAATPAGDMSMIAMAPWVLQAPGNVQATEGIPGGLYQPTVFFDARRLNNGSPGPWHTIGEGECRTCDEYYPDDSAGGILNSAISYQGPLWSIYWDTKTQGPDGEYIWFSESQDGSDVQIRVRARDAWGNEETVVSDAIYHLIVDNIAPHMTVALQSPAGTAVTEVQRNSQDGLLIQATGGGSTLVNNDLIVSFYYKLATDLDADGSWRMVPEQYGIDTADRNPDITRPYVFHLNTNGFRDTEGDPFIPNVQYNFAVEVSDLVCNATPVVGATKRNEAGTIKFVDTIAPVATITNLIRDYDDAECHVDEFENVEHPTGERVNGIAELWARVLDGSRDTQDVKFYYRAKGTISWTLADADVTLKDLDSYQTWTLANWSSASLAEGTWEFAAVATDDAGNTDANPPVIEIQIDRTGPAFTAVNPVDGKIIVPENLDPDGGNSGPWIVAGCDPDKRVADLITISTAPDVAYKNSWDNCVWYQWKYSADEGDVEDPEGSDSNWNTIPDNMVLFDGFTHRYSATIDVLDVFGNDARLVDWRVVATDVAGNTKRTVFAKKTVVDNVDPDVEITYFDVDGEVDTTIRPIKNREITDVSHGDQVHIYATVDDDEPNLPDAVDTDVVEVQFFIRNVNYDAGGQGAPGEWRLLGTAGYDANLGLWGVTWNTTGLTSTGNEYDSYEITAFATDEAANCGEAHSTVRVRVENKAVPLAQVAAFNPDLLSVVTKGTNDRVYGLTFGEKEADQVFFQYRPVGAATWTTIGIGVNTHEVLTTRQVSLIDQYLWYAMPRSSNWAAGTNIEFRAVAANPVPGTSVSKPGDDGGLALKSTIPGQGGVEMLDGDPNIFSGLYDLDNTPILMARVDRAEDGSTVITPNEDLGYFDSLKVYVTDSITSGRIEVDTTDPTLAPFVVVVAEDFAGRIDEYIPEMDKKISDATVWTGELYHDTSTFNDDNDQGENPDGISGYLDPTEGALVTIYASASKKRATAEAPAPRTEMATQTLRFHQVTQNKGTNGVAGVDGRGNTAADGYPTDMFAMEIPAGAYSSRYALLIKRTDMPLTPESQDRYIDTVGEAYRTSLHNSSWSLVTTDAASGYAAKAWIRYNEADLNGADESKLSVRYWDGSEWTRSGVTHISVDTDANVISFRTDEIGTRIWTVVATDEAAPVEMTFVPEWNGFTDQDPIIRGIARVEGGYFDTGSFELYIDGKLVYSSYEDWFLYPGSEFDWEYVTNEDHTIAWEYRHSCNDKDALKDGEHTAKFVFQDEDEYSLYGTNEEFTFYVDRSAPYVKLYGGYVGNPALHLAAGYVNLNQDVITAELYDPESGIHFREDRVRDFFQNDGSDICSAERDYNSFCELDWVYCGSLDQTDYGFKYDVWVVRTQQESNGDPDEIEDRTLIHTGTADEVAPFTTPALREYSPEDTLRVPLQVLTGGSMIDDGQVLEITIYSHRLFISPCGNDLSGLLDTYFGNGGGDPLENCGGILPQVQSLLLLLEGMGIQVDFDTATGLYVAYLNGVVDNVYNSGSQFVEQRYIVDETAPVFVPTSAGVSCDGTPAEAVPQTECYVFSGAFMDDGVGVNPETVQIRVTGPEGQMTPADLVVGERNLSFKVCGSEGARLNLGSYTVAVSGKDRVGNAFSSVCSFTVGSNVVQVEAAKVFPNPFNPASGNATISFTLPKAAEVTVRAYDWSGDFVAQIFKGSLPVGEANLTWGGQAEDGTPLANGVYLIHVVADDGSRQEPKIIKVALWNER